MNKIILIIKREYLTRIRKRTFIIGTILFPLLYLLLIFGTSYIAEKTRGSLNVGIIDETGYFNDSMVARVNKKDSANKLSLVRAPRALFDSTYNSIGYDGYIVISD